MKGLLENLVGLTTDMILAGRFKDDPPVEDRMTHDRDSLRFELFHNIDGPDGAALAPHVQRIVKGLIPVLDDGPGKDLLRSIAGEADRDPQSSDAAERAIDRAQAIADATTPEQLTQAQQQLRPDDDPVPVTSSDSFVAQALGWRKPAGEFLAPASAVTTILVAAGVSGPISVALGATIGLLWLFRPKDP